ncbi:MAG: hypothetical protein COB59_03820 [Rhodospirillaceae bacterium]|nr:MAG: hypothetical protein COB59_03820 [Rhodospirillaceae bacterium]
MIIYRHHFYSAALSIAVINAVLRPAIALIREDGWLAALMGGFGISFVIPMAFVFGIKLLLIKSRDTVCPRDWAVLIAALFALLIPSATLAWLVAAALAMFAMSRFSDPFSNQWARAGLSIIIFAALREPMAAVLLKLLATPLLDTDAIMTAMLLKLFISDASSLGNIVTGPGGHRLLILTGCTSYTNLSIALLGWFTLSRSCRAFMDIHQVIAGLFVAGFVVGLNVVRLVLMAVGPVPYHFFHDGIGSSLFQVTLITVTILISLMGVRRNETR